MTAVLLDLDGTLTDPRTGILACLRHALAGVGEPCPRDAALERFIGPPLQASFAALFGAGSPKIARALELYRERFSSVGLYENRLYPGIPAALAALAGAGAKLVLATSKPQPFAERIVEHFGLGDHLSALYGSELDGTRADKTALIAHVLQAERVPAASAFMVGDREHDMIGARANAVCAVGALWGYGSREELVRAGASSLCETPAALPGVIARAAPNADHRGGRP